jgi:two-component system, chemotaxis family, protein-glutamate methylesterase/glutaminase
MIEVLIVEDSKVVREYLQYLLEEDGEVRVVGAVENGREAVEFVRQQRPDVVTMDIHMPVMDGFEATRMIMEEQPVPIVIVSASWDLEEVDKAFRALEVGAVSALEKPHGLGNPENEKLAREFVQTVKLMAEVKVVRRWAKKPQPESPKEKPERRSAAVELVAIGASTGGPNALHRLLAELPKDFPVPILIVQHIAPGFLQGMASWLGQSCDLPAHIATQGERFERGHAYLAPDNFHMGIGQGLRVELSRAVQEYYLRPAVSYLFRSVAAQLGERAVGILLTGMGRDGAEELKKMRDRGAITMAQDEESSVVHGMPGEAIKLGGVDYVLPPEEIGRKLASLVHGG